MSKQAYKRVRRALNNLELLHFSDVVFPEVSRKPLDAYAWPGGYPLYYQCADSGALCPDCANKEITLIDSATKEPGTDKQWELRACCVNWEDATLHCDHCSKRIESAYAEDSAE